MKHYLSLIIILIAAVCPAATIFQPWDVNNWTWSVGTGTNPATVVHVVTGDSDVGNYLNTDLYRNTANNGVSKIYIPLGDANVPVGIQAGAVPEMWIQYDFKPTGGDAYRFASALGIFNNAGDNDYDPNINDIILMNTANARTQIRARCADGVATSAYVSSDGSSIHRVKAHIYNSGGQTIVDVNIYGVDIDTLATHHIGSITGFVLLGSGQSFNQTLDVLGVKNLDSATGTPPAHNAIMYDNIYFSTEGPQTGTVPYPFMKICNDDTADYDGNCKVNFKDFAVLADEWTNCAYIPARLCD